MQDLVISAVSEYNSDKLKYWVNSLEKTGYTGKKAVICFNILDTTISWLEQHGFIVVLTSTNRNSQNTGYHFSDNFTYQVPYARHYFYWKFLSTLSDIRYVISTDISDVIFQINPSTWLEHNLGEYKLNYGSEGLKYKDEDWGRDNFKHCYGEELFELVKTREIYNAGSMAGEFNVFKDFSLAVHLAATNAQHNPTPDQAAVNLILSLEPFKSITKFNDHDINWACECGTTVDPSKIDKFRLNLVTPEPYFDGLLVRTSNGDPYCMVHQYNRVPEWKSQLEAIYE